MKCLNGIESEECSCYACKINHPLTPEHLALTFIERWQHSSFVHPLTCADDSKVLEPFIHEGTIMLVCPTCGYQEYAPEFFFNISYDDLLTMIRNPYADLFRSKENADELEPSD